MAAQREIDADKAMQHVLNAWGAIRTSSPEPHPLSADFNALFSKMLAYRTAKSVCDNHREHHKLSVQDVAEERRTKNEFLDAYKAFYETRN
jgi:hypothetical protein